MSEVPSIIQGLDRISKWAERHPEQTSYWIPGIDCSEIEKIFKGFPFKIPTELYHLYEHGYTLILYGSEPSHFLQIQTSLSQCLSYWILPRIERGAFSPLGTDFFHLYEGCFEKEKYRKVLNQYPLDWCEFPICYGFGKEGYLVRVYKTQTDYSPVWIRFIGGSPVLYASSLTNLILTMAECYETGAYSSIFVEEDNDYELQEDLTKIKPIFQKYNPDQMDVWNDIWED